jgi:DNA/RNA-binding domain of Phe-tRNA-synthetase-like protein
MINFTVSEDWRRLYPGASVGIMVMNGVNNPPENAALNQEKDELELAIRQQYRGFDRQSLKSLPLFEAYRAYYKRFKKSYHVQLQMESVAFKGKSIPRVASLVEAMFMAELKNLLLTAGHDRAKLEMPPSIHVANGSEQFVRINGQEQILKKGDMFIADAQGIISSIIYGPDQRTRINPDTQQVLFTTYAPPGIDPVTVGDHLQDIERYVRLITPAATTEMLKVFWHRIRQ